jgi:hypothetical protein
LGLKRVDWNKVAVLKHIWNIFTQVGSLWVAWVNEVLLRGRCFQTVKIPHECTWGWRKLLKLDSSCDMKLVMGKAYSCGMIDGIQMVSCIRVRAFYDAASTLEAKVESVLKNKG